jgi:hypothetical protein
VKYVELGEYERRLDSRKARLGYSGRAFVRPNSGVSRKPAKRTLLRKLAEALRAAGRKSRFTAEP